MSLDIPLGAVSSTGDSKARWNGLGSTDTSAMQAVVDVWRPVADIGAIQVAERALQVQDAEQDADTAAVKYTVEDMVALICELTKYKKLDAQCSEHVQ